jgi:thiol:disulfide interchange protein DsbD
MGAALLAPPLMAMAIFLALALGFAAPFSVLALAPGLARLLPRPGAWMVIFRQAMAFPVFGAAAFFLWVLARQTGTNGLALALAGGVAIAFAAWLFEKSKQSRRGLWLRAAALVAMAASLAPAMDLRLVETASASEYGDIEAEPFSAAHVATLRAGGAGVFVDFTAAWCITCQVNKRTVLSRRSLAAAFASRNVALLTADWTLRDPEITAALEGFGASGVPLYVYYPPTGDPKIIPQPLTEAAILAALQS